MLYAQQSFAHSQDIYEWDTLPRGVRVQGRITLDDLQNALSDNGSGLPTIGIPVEFSRDQIQSGNMISKQCEDCLILKKRGASQRLLPFCFHDAHNRECLDHFHLPRRLQPDVRAKEQAGGKKGKQQLVPEHFGCGDENRRSFPGGGI